MSQSQWNSKLELAPCLWTLEERWEISFQLSWATVVKPQLKPINKTKRMSVVFDLELFVILRAVRCWRQCVTNCAIVIYTDNDAVRDCLISRNTPSSKTQDLFWTCTWRSNLKQPSTLGCPGFLRSQTSLMTPPGVIANTSLHSDVWGQKLMWTWCGMTCRTSTQRVGQRPAVQPTIVSKMCEWSTARV